MSKLNWTVQTVEPYVHNEQGQIKNNIHNEFIDLVFFADASVQTSWYKNCRSTELVLEVSNVNTPWRQYELV